MLAIGIGLQGRRPQTIERASRPEADGGLPEEPGIYAWWTDLPSPLSHVPSSELPFGWGLLYCGVAPRNANSAATLRSRVLKQHVNGTIGSSTFRRALTAFMWEDFGWSPYLTDGGKLALPPDENDDLTRWISENPKVSWLVVREPWRYEREPIDSLSPPLNSQFNAGHPFYRDLRRARARLAEAARRNTRTLDD